MRDWFADIAAKFRAPSEALVTEVTEVTEGSSARESAGLKEDNNVTIQRMPAVTEVTPDGMANRAASFLSPVTDVTGTSSTELQIASPSEPAEKLGLRGDVTSVTNVTPIFDDEKFAERAAIIEEGAAVPRAWAEGYARLCTMPRPAYISERNWGALIDATGGFLDRWGSRAAQLGWKPEDLFGVHREAPLERFDLAGLVRFLIRHDVLELGRDYAVIGNEAGVRQTFRVRPYPSDDVGCLIWELLPTKAAS
jgi:hypothetical protein